MRLVLVLVLVLALAQGEIVSERVGELLFGLHLRRMLALPHLLGLPLMVRK